MLSQPYQKNSLLQHPWIKQFNLMFNMNKYTSYKTQFCMASIDVLEMYFTKNKLSENLIKELNMCQSNQKLFDIINSLPALAKEVKETSLDLIQFLKYVSKLHSRHWANIKKHTSSTTFSYNELTQIHERKSLQTTEFKATMMPQKDFIKFSLVDSAEPKLNNTKLRLSIDEKQFPNAWELIKEHFLSLNCPITAFKIINLPHSYKKIEEFTQAVSINGFSIADEKIKNQLRDYKRLISGGQITLYLPITLDENTYESIAKCLHIVVQTLLKNNITPGERPSDDRALNSYISGRVEKESGEYILPKDAIIKNSLDPVLNAFEKLLTLEVERNCCADLSPTQN